MTEIHKGIPDFVGPNANFKRGRQAANDIANAGPGHHTVVEFDIRENPDDIKSFLGGARYVQRNHSTIKVARRTDSKSGVIKVYIINDNN